METIETDLFHARIKKPILEQRTVPSQKRAEATVHNILKTAAQLLEEVGIDGFNTNLLAERAGLRVATVYRYFPNKLAILTAVVEQWMDSLRYGMRGAKDFANKEIDWHETVEQIIDGYITLAKRQVGFSAIRRALQATPELRALELSFIEEISSVAVKYIEKRGLNTDHEKLTNAFNTYLATSTAVVDLAWNVAEGEDFSDPIIEQLKLLFTSYFAHYLE